MTNRNLLLLLLLLAPIGWAAFILFTGTVQPTTPLAFCVFFLLLGVALTSTLSPLAYVISLRFISSRLYRATVRHSLRQGVLLSLCIMLNLLLRALHSWNIFTAIVIFAAAFVIEILCLAKK
jgi:hypothetical protein